MKAAICTTDGNCVDLHFGKTSLFYIYEIDQGTKSFLEKRKIEAYSPAPEFLTEKGVHSFDEVKFERVFETIKDCKKLYTTSIGDVPRSKLAEKGIEVKLCNCEIEMIPTCSGNCK